MKIPHDPVALERHFKDDDKGPLSNQGYMPYLSQFILDKVGTKVLKRESGKSACVLEMILIHSQLRFAARQIYCRHL